VTVWIIDADANDVSGHQVLDQMLDPGDAREITLSFSTAVGHL
jgi:hypothetical protein